MVRPSTRSTLKASSVTTTLCANVVERSTGEVVIPAPQEFTVVFSHEGYDSINLGPAEATTLLQANGIEPDLRYLVIPFNVNMFGLRTIAGVKEEPVWSNPENARHSLPR